MKDWSYTFKPVSKQEWLRQIEADLKQRPVESLFSEWWEGEPLNPLITAEDLTGEIIRLPDSLFVTPPALTEAIPTHGLPATAIHKKVHEALQSGAQIILFQTTGLDPLFDPAWIDGVFPEMISIHTGPDGIDENAPDTVNAVPDYINIRFSISSASHHSSFITHNSSFIICHFPEAGHWIHSTSEILNRLIRNLHAWTDSAHDPADFLRRCILLPGTDTEFFLLIIQTRVLHLLWHNLVFYFTGSAPADDIRYMEHHIHPHETETPGHFLIRSSSLCLAAALAGSHALCIHHGAGNLPGHSGRTSRNIQHLLHYESGIYKGEDPLAGAYAIDYYVKKWVEEIWELLHLKNV